MISERTKAAQKIKLEELTDKDGLVHTVKMTSETLKLTARSTDLGTDYALATLTDLSSDASITLTGPECHELALMFEGISNRLVESDRTISAPNPLQEILDIARSRLLVDALNATDPEVSLANKLDTIALIADYALRNES